VLDRPRLVAMTFFYFFSSSATVAIGLLPRQRLSLDGLFRGGASHRI
jgi:hypothetical protein